MKILDIIFGALFILFLIWLVYNLLFGYADWLNSSNPSSWEYEQATPNYPH